jgi:hypothetical protein
MSKKASNARRLGIDLASVLVAIVRKRLGLEASLYQTLQILSVTLFEKTPISQALQTFDLEANLLGGPNQLILFNL